MCNANPLGPGVGWLWPYYIETINELGETVERPEGVPFVITNVDERTQKVYTSTRVWFFGKLSDNPYQDTPQYRAALLAQPKHIRDAYYFGIANRRQGAFFTDVFRKKPNIDNNEPVNAQHVYPKALLEKSLRKWMPVTMAIDWGHSHEAVILLGQVQPVEKRLYVVDGYGAPRMTTDEVGIRAGKMLLPYHTCQEGVVKLFLSPDAFSRESEIESESVRIYKGMCKVIGADRVWLQGEDPTDENSTEGAAVAIVRAHNKRAMGWSLCYEWLAWQTRQQDAYKFTEEEAQQIYIDKGMDAQAQYYRRWRMSLPELLPRMLIAAELEGLVDAIPKAMRDNKNPDDVVKTHWDGADWVDAWRYLVMGCKLSVGEEPARMKQQRILEEAKERDATPQELLWLNRYQEGQRADDPVKDFMKMLNSPDMFDTVDCTLQ
jgi:hypothetical protein